MKKNKTAVIISISSDIGLALTKSYVKNGYNIIGTYRSKSCLKKISGLPNCRLFRCDISNKRSIAGFVGKFRKTGAKWDVFISCVGSQEPIGLFFGCDFDEWSNSVHINAIEQLRILHMLHRFRNKNSITNAIFFAGGGTNNPVAYYSAYTISKVMLIKMCELLDDENSDMNVFIIGPGWVKTKIHHQTLRAGLKGIKNYQKTKAFLESGSGTDMNDIFACIQWLIRKGRRVSGGRNFSVVFDKWKDKDSEKLAHELAGDTDMYKLRRFKNNWGAEK